MFRHTRLLQDDATGFWARGGGGARLEELVLQQLGGGGPERGVLLQALLDNVVQLLQQSWKAQTCTLPVAKPQQISAGRILHPSSLGNMF